MPPPLRFALLALLTPVLLPAAGWTITTFAGTGVLGFSGDGGPATAAQINDPYGIVRGPDGAIWFCEHNGHRIRRVAPDGTITTVAGTGERAYTGDGGPATAAALNLPHELRFDRAGNLFIADTGNNAVRRVDAKTGIITTIAGGRDQARRGYSGDGGPAGAAALRGPHSIQFGPDGNLYICDVGNHVIRLVDMKTGLITTFAGTGKPGPTPDGSPISGTPLNNPRSLDVDADGNLWLVTREGNQVLKFDLKAGVIRHIAGTGVAGFTGNGGPAKLATLSGPKGIALDAAGNAWLADTESHTVRMIDAKTGHIEVVAGTGAVGNGGDGDPLACAMNRLHGVFVDADGSVFIGDSEAHRVRVLRRATAATTALPLFNGRNLDGWTIFTPDKDLPTSNNLFEVTEGTLHTYPGAVNGSKQPIGYLITNAEYSNYRLSLEYKWGAGKYIPRADPDVARDAGVCYHVQLPNVIWPTSVECQIQEGDTGDAWLIHTQATSRVHPDTTGFWPPSQPNGVEVTKGEKPNVYRRFIRHYCHEQPGWNRVELVVRGDRASYYVNGHLVNEVTQLKRWDEAAKAWLPLTKGRILLQAEGAEIFYRNVTLQPLPPS